MTFWQRFWLKLDRLFFGSKLPAIKKHVGWRPTEKPLEMPRRSMERGSLSLRRVA